MARMEVLKPFVRFWEGGFAEIPGDSGGPTKWGVTLGTFREYFGRRKTVDDLKAMTEEQWDEIFRKKFWDRCKGDGIRDQGVANMLVDWTYNAGANGIKNAQKVLGVTADGIVGPKTLAAINDSFGECLFIRLKYEREQYYRRIATGAKAKFLAGWLNRNDSICYASLRMGEKKITW